MPLTRRCGAADKGSIGSILYDLSDEVVGDHICQVELYNLEHMAESSKSRFPSTSEQVFDVNLRPCKKTPFWVLFDVGRDSIFTARKERSRIQKMVDHVKSILPSKRTITEDVYPQTSSDTPSSLGDRSDATPMARRLRKKD